MGTTAATDGLSPLVEVERAVQERAKATSLDMSADDGAIQLRKLIEDEVLRWSDDFKRGLRPFDLPDPELLIERAHRNLAGYGPLQPLLEDDNVWEIMINAPDLVAVGDWDCDGAPTPAVLRPSSAQIHLFQGWAASGQVETASPGPTVPPGAVALEAGACGHASVRTSDGSVLDITTGGGH